MYTYSIQFLHWQSGTLNRKLFCNKAVIKYPSKLYFRSVNIFDTGMATGKQGAGARAHRTWGHMLTLTQRRWVLRCAEIR